MAFERLLNARREPDNWLTYYGAYDGQRYSALDQITRDNLVELRPAWTFQFGQIGLAATPATYAFEAAPLVIDGVTASEEARARLLIRSLDLRWTSSIGRSKVRASMARKSNSAAMDH